MLTNEYAERFAAVAVGGLFDQLRRNRELELNAEEQKERCRIGACLTKDAEYHGDGIPSTCRFCGKPGEPCVHPPNSWCTGCRNV